MAFLELYLITALGIVISIMLPILRRFLPKVPILRRLLPKGAPAGVEGVWDKMKPYVLVGVFSLLTALLIVAFVGDALQDWRVAILAGYAWDSTLQKIAT